MTETKKIMDNLIQELKRGTLVLTVLLNSEESCYGGYRRKDPLEKS